jgi:hypothetical protein
MQGKVFIQPQLCYDPKIQRHVANRAVKNSSSLIEKAMFLGSCSCISDILLPHILVVIQESNDVSQVLRFFRRIISAELIPIRVSQFRKLNLQSDS